MRDSNNTKYEIHVAIAAPKQLNLFINNMLNMIFVNPLITVVINISDVFFEAVNSVPIKLLIEL